jgi:glucose-1-phosphatase
MSEGADRRAPRRYLLLDLSGVACQMDHPARLARLAAACDVSAADLHEAVWASGLDDDFDRGRFTRDEIVELFRERFGFRGDLAEFERAWAAGFVPDEDVLAVVDGLDPSVGRAILSDNSAVLLDAMPRFLPDLWRRFDHVLFSCEIKALKPAPATFQYALDRLGCAPADVLFFDDRAANVEAARSLGIEAEVFVNAREAAAHIGQTWPGLITS